MNKKVLFILGLGVVAIISCFCLSRFRNKSFEVVPDGYIAVFHGGSSGVTYETYIYKQEGIPDAAYGYEYINVTTTVKFWGSFESRSKITGRGYLHWTDSVFVAAKENNAYSYVTLPNDSKIYSIDEFAHMFVLN